MNDDIEIYVNKIQIKCHMAFHQMIEADSSRKSGTIFGSAHKETNKHSIASNQIWNLNRFTFRRLSSHYVIVKSIKSNEIGSNQIKWQIMLHSFVLWKRSN